VDGMSGRRRFLHLVRAGAEAPPPEVLADDDTVVRLDGAEAPDADRLLDLILEHDTVVTW